MATKPTLLRAVAVISILIIQPLLITSHTLLRKRSDDIHNNDQNFSAEEHHDYISTKILTKLIPSTNITSSSSSASASPMACIHQENKLKKCYEKLPQSFNEIKCTQCIYGNVNPSTQVITCPHSDYCSSVSGCTKGVCPKECKVEFYEVLNCIWEKAGCGVTAGVGDGECGVANKMKKKGKKKVASDPYPSRGGTAATVAATTSTTSTSTKAAAAVSSKNGSNPCSECSTSEGGARHNFCGNLNVNPIQDACSSQTECSDRGLKCKVCTKVVNNDGYGGKSVEEDVGSGAYVCVKDEEEEGDKKTAPAAEGKGGGNDITSAATSAASSSTSLSTTKKQKGADTAVTTTTTSATGKKKQKGVTTTTTTTSSTTPAGGFCHSRAVVLGNCIFNKDTSPDCLNCIYSGTQEDSSDDPTCKQVQQHQFCTNIASCAKEHCGKCTFEFYTGLNCVLQKIPGCEQFSCAIGGGGIEGAISSSGGVGGGYDASSDGYSLQQFRDDVERQCKMMNQRMEVEDEVFVREA
mmetsp:Transcript_26546/g.41197  ORF Transcript_26546/g.41197 Transcript_26546/m.41197 type:complete len:522 (+) Transcript_26546:56-1621(+)